MALASLKTRIERLEAKHKVGAKILGISMDGTPMWREVMRDGVLHCLPRYEHDEWAERCRMQQADLQQALRGYAKLLNDEAPQAEAPVIVGTVANNPAPLKPGRKQPNFVHLADGTEIKIKRN
ncbi:hypothetical protein BFP70_08620 [Thioclava sp. SK-1]|uniref:hypothetical protein n=1 Tax=Thioclava sp. SK-1 TaxID=1889770 RepID=UPI000825FB43|nr:hypothetical protein [Thioclava sp. SK-1]OCX66153.1 hypothetical protein BFP70_08620 [Thioclava sp. SK-1]